VLRFEVFGAFKVRDGAGNFEDPNNSLRELSGLQGLAKNGRIYFATVPLVGAYGLKSKLPDADFWGAEIGLANTATFFRVVIGCGQLLTNELLLKSNSVDDPFGLSENAQNLRQSSNSPWTRSIEYFGRGISHFFHHAADNRTSAHPDIHRMASHGRSH